MQKAAAADKPQLYADFIRLRPQHTSNAATHRALAIRYGLSVNTIRKYVGAAERVVVAKNAQTEPVQKMQQLGHNPFPNRKISKPVTFESEVDESTEKVA